MPSVRHAQIDILKGLAILGVLVTHSWSAEMLRASGAAFHLWQAVPVFMTFLGMNAGIGFTRSPARGLRDAYGREYWMSRWRRIGIPFAWVFAASSVIAAVEVLTVPGYHANVGGFTLVGQLPSGGPGNYFVTVLIQFAIVGPVLWFAYRRKPAVALGVAVLLDLGFEVWAAQSPFVAAHPYVHSANILRFLVAIVLGMWISDDWRLGARRNRFILVAAGVSALYLAANVAYSWTLPVLLPDAPVQNLVSFPYAALLVLLGMRFLPSTERGRAARALARTGRWSYHIFLVQILWFSTLSAPIAGAIGRLLGSAPGAPAVMLVASVVNAGVCVAAGGAFYRVLRPTARAGSAA